MEDLPKATHFTTIQVLLGCIAIGKGLLILGTIISEFTQDEWTETLDTYLDWSNLFRQPQETN